MKLPEPIHQDMASNSPRESRIATAKHPYNGRTIVLTTKHDKFNLIAPILKSELGLNVVLHEADTDRLGTFSGEVERALSPRQTAIQKAKIGINALGHALGIASEGSIGPDSQLPFSQSDIEYLALVDTDLGIEVVERYRSLEIVAGDIVAEPDTYLEPFLERADFPNHKLIATPNSARSKNSIKGISNRTELEDAIVQLAKVSGDGKVLIQSDFRAHCSPSRQKNIVQATILLANRVKALCPECKAPGWGLVGYQIGLDCSSCGETVPNAISANISGCAKCPFEQIGEPLAKQADPANCDGCNP